MSQLNIFDYIGLAGVLMALFAYARVQWRRDFVRTLPYSALNLIGAVLMIISLSVNRNFPAFVFCVFWTVISLYGVYRCLNYVRRGRTMTPMQ